MQETSTLTERLSPHGLNYRLIRSESGSQTPPVVLVMGYGGSLLSWPPAFVHELAQKRDVLIFDNRGTGKSGKLERGADLRMIHFVEDLHKLLEHLQWGRVDLLGYSMGGCIALEFASQHPGQVRKLVLQSTTAGGALYTSSDQDVKERIMNPRGTTFDEMFFDFFSICFSESAFEKHRPDLQVICEQSRPYPTSPMVLLAQLAAFRNFDASTFVNGLQAQALLIHGLNDRLIKPENGKSLAEVLPGCQTLFLPETGHCPHIEHKAIVVDRINKFLTNE